MKNKSNKSSRDLGQGPQKSLKNLFLREKKTFIFTRTWEHRINISNLTSTTKKKQNKKSRNSQKVNGWQRSRYYGSVASTNKMGGAQRGQGDGHTPREGPHSPTSPLHVRGLTHPPDIGWPSCFPRPSSCVNSESARAGSLARPADTRTETPTPPRPRHTTPELTSVIKMSIWISDKQ